jgi:hypothetical protein
MLALSVFYTPHPKEKSAGGKSAGGKSIEGVGGPNGIIPINIIPTPVNISYLWNFGSLLGLCLAIQIVTGIALAMHYVELLFQKLKEFFYFFSKEIHIGLK